MVLCSRDGWSTLASQTLGFRVRKLGTHPRFRLWITLAARASVVGATGCELDFDPVKVGLPDGLDAAMFDGIVLRDGSFQLVDGHVPDWNEYFGLDGGAGALVDLAGKGEGQQCTVQDDECRSGLTCVNQVCAPARDQPMDAWCLISAECSDGQCVDSRCTAGGMGQLRAGCMSSADCASGLRCGTEGLQPLCVADGAADVGSACDHINDCRAGLSCVVDKGRTSCQPVGSTDLTPGMWTGVGCEEETGPVRAYFEVPQAAGSRSADFFRLPFPNAVHTDAAGGLHLSGFPTPGNNPLVGRDPVAPYVAGLEGQVGFSPSSAVQFRFSGQVNFDSLAVPGAIEWVDITDPTTPQWASLTYRSSPSRNNYVCSNGLSVRRSDVDPMLPGHTYAIWMTTDVQTSKGDQIERAENLVSLLSEGPPSDPVLLSHYAKYAPLREYLTGVGVPVSRVLNATVFTVARPETTMTELARTVEATPVPTATAWTKCEAGVASPCPQAEGVRGCGSHVAFDEYHLLVNMPIFQQGAPPYEDVGGDVQTGAPVRYEQVCASLTVPKTTPADQALPLVISTHGTGGSFRTHVDSGVSASLAAVPVAGQVVSFAVLGFDQVQHGPRRGDSLEPPDNLFFNFLNPDASRGNPLQGAVDLMSMVRFARTLHDGGGPVVIDPERVLVFGHSQGSMHASLALPYIPNVKAAVLSGNGVSLMHGLLTKTLPVNISELVPLLISDGLRYDRDTESVRGQVPGGTHHPVLSVIQRHIDPGDGVNFARILTAANSQHPTHVFQTFGVDDRFSPPVTLRIFAGVAGLAVARADESASPPYDLGPEWASYPVTQTLTNGETSFTAAVRQYGPPALSDGHFVAFQVPAAVEDVRQFLAQAALGLAPAVGR